MTPFTREDLLTLDLDWFAVDPAGHLGHFTTAGGLLVPSAVVESRERTERLDAFFCGLEPVPGAYVEGFEAGRRVPWPDARRRATYFDAFGEWAERGLFSHDCVRQGDQDGPYFLAARPLHPLRLDQLPAEIQEDLAPLQLPVRLGEVSVLTLENLSPQGGLR